MEPKTCPYCGKEFKPRNIKQKICGETACKKASSCVFWAAYRQRPEYKAYQKEYQRQYDKAKRKPERAAIAAAREQRSCPYCGNQYRSGQARRITCGGQECQRMHARARAKAESFRDARRKSRQKPEVKEKERSYRRQPAALARKRAYEKSVLGRAARARYESKPEVRRRKLERSQTVEARRRIKEYQQTPEYKVWRRAYVDTPEYKNYMRLYGIERTRQQLEHELAMILGRPRGID